MSIILAPSILAADFANLQSEVQMLNQSAADWIHIDIMDGVFVPNISFGLPVCEAIHQHSDKPLDVHLMIVQPERYLADFKKAGADILTVHYEACPHLHRTIQEIKDLGCQSGVALNPHTPVWVLEDVIQEIDLVCLMSVNPGFGGQKFIEHTYLKIKQLQEICTRNQAHPLIEIDGGVGEQNILQLYEAGANVMVAGSSVFRATDPISTMAKFKTMCA